MAHEPSESVIEDERLIGILRVDEREFRLGPLDGRVAEAPDRLKLNVGLEEWIERSLEKLVELEIRVVDRGLGDVTHCAVPSFADGCGLIRERGRDTVDVLLLVGGDHRGGGHTRVGSATDATWVQTRYRFRQPIRLSALELHSGPDGTLFRRFATRWRDPLTASARPHRRIRPLAPRLPAGYLRSPPRPFRRSGRRVPFPLQAARFQQ